MNAAMDLRIMVASVVSFEVLKFDLLFVFILFLYFQLAEMYLLTNFDDII